MDTKLLGDSFSSMERMCAKTQLYRTSAVKFRHIMKKATSKPIPTEKLAGTIYRAAVAPHPRASYTVGAGLALRLFSALPANTQAALLKKLLK